MKYTYSYHIRECGDEKHAEILDNNGNILFRYDPKDSIATTIHSIKKAMEESFCMGSGSKNLCMGQAYISGFNDGLKHCERIMSE